MLALKELILLCSSILNLKKLKVVFTSYTSIFSCFFSQRLSVTTPYQPLPESATSTHLKAFIVYKEPIFLKTLILHLLNRFLIEQYQHTLNTPLIEKFNSFMEYYLMEAKMIQFIIHEIIKTEEYTLEGIAYHTRIPLDIVIDAACGINNNISITFWSKILDLYFQIKPEIFHLLIKKLTGLKEPELLNCLKS